jgi:hypothetical protein
MCAAMNAKQEQDLLCPYVLSAAFGYRCVLPTGHIGSHRILSELNQRTFGSNSPPPIATLTTALSKALSLRRSAYAKALMDFSEASIALHLSQGAALEGTGKDAARTALNIARTYYYEAQKSRS